MHKRFGFASLFAALVLGLFLFGCTTAPGMGPNGTNVTGDITGVVKKDVKPVPAMQLPAHLPNVVISHQLLLSPFYLYVFKVYGGDPESEQYAIRITDLPNGLGYDHMALDKNYANQQLEDFKSETFKASSDIRITKEGNYAMIWGYLDENVTPGDYPISICAVDMFGNTGCGNTTLTVDTGCPSTYDGEWSGTMSFKFCNYRIFNTPCTYLTTKDTSIKVKMECVKVQEEKMDNGEWGEQAVMKITDFQADLPFFGCSQSCKPADIAHSWDNQEYYYANRIAITQGGTGTPVQLELPSKVLLGWDDIVVTDDGKIIDGAKVSVEDFRGGANRVPESGWCVAMLGYDPGDMCTMEPYGEFILEKG